MISNPQTEAQRRALAIVRYKREVTFAEARRVNGLGTTKVWAALERQGLAIKTARGYKRVPKR